MALDLSSIPCFSPVSAALVTFCSSKGEAWVQRSSWLGLVGSDPLVLSLALQMDGAKDIPCLDKGFVVNLAADNLLDSPLFIGHWERQQDEGTLPRGLTLGAAAVVGAPLIEECPVRIECIGGRVRRRCNPPVITGEVVAVHMGRSVCGEGSLPTGGRGFRGFFRSWQKALSWPVSLWKIDGI